MPIKDIVVVDFHKAGQIRFAPVSDDDVMQSCEHQIFFKPSNW